MLNQALSQQAEKLDREGVPYAVATVVRAQSPTAGKPGDKALVTAEGELFGWIGGGCAQPAVIKTAKKVINDIQPLLIRVQPSGEIEEDDGVVSFKSSCPSGGTLDIFIEPLQRQEKLWVFGSSPVAVKLAQLATVADYSVHVVAPFGDAELFPTAVHHQKDLLIEPHFLTEPSYAVVATQGKKDIPALKSAMSLSTYFLGFVASAKKAEVYKKKLIESGIEEAAVSAIESPVGLEINARSASDIALAILAQLARVKNANDKNISRASSQSGQRDSSAGTQVANGCCSKNNDKPADQIKDPIDQGSKSSVETSGGCCGN